MARQQRETKTVAWFIGVADSCASWCSSRCSRICRGALQAALAAGRDVTVARTIKVWWRGAAAPAPAKGIHVFPP
jgi:hypothetical protein